VLLVADHALVGEGNCVIRSAAWPERLGGSSGRPVADVAGLFPAAIIAARAARSPGALCERIHGVQRRVVRITAERGTAAVMGATSRVGSQTAGEGSIARQRVTVTRLEGLITAAVPLVLLCGNEFRSSAHPARRGDPLVNLPTVGSHTHAGIVAAAVRTDTGGDPVVLDWSAKLEGPA
jgi:hypothetical protein